jgi:hypothetical protein
LGASRIVDEYQKGAGLIEGGLPMYEKPQDKRSVQTKSPSKLLEVSLWQLGFFTLFVLFGLFSGSFHRNSTNPLRIPRIAMHPKRPTRPIGRPTLSSWKYLD